MKKNQSAILCDSCNKWTHCGCSSVSETEYQAYQAKDSLLWICPRCVANELPFNDCSVVSSISDADDIFSDADDMFPDASSIHIAHLNVRSLTSSIDDVHCLLLDNKIDVLAVSETWLDTSIGNAEVCPDGYDLLRRDRNRNGGGVGIFVNNSLRYIVRPDLETINIESIWIEIYPSSRKRSM